MKNILAKTKTYLIGPMQYAEGRTWREDISEFLNSIDVTIFDPYKKPFINTYIKFIQYYLLQLFQSNLCHNKFYEQLIFYNNRQYRFLIFL